ncbi:hypothetical protein LTS08_007026 [Lithohypha guttulata]|uniref:uncharacterized protein n=1 Tax=Lithohypha guttulata TaxID=1690604 RepID=UPI002DE18050|nr:hypothetical protein LTR51_002076 [Lithohypha guttulata]KAK5097611.1 hypothetical protein LTS08_007026 [Lithohypha guttulata]
MQIIRAIVASLSLATLASCTDTPSSSGAERVVQIVQVGDANGTLKFFPEKIKADVGSVVQFQFYPRNHTITESSFAAPCIPIAANLTTPERPGQRSGFVPVTADAQFRPIYNLIVNDTRPMWIFCGQQPHCIRGMAMVINQNETDPAKTLEKYKEAAALLPPPPGAAGSSAASSAPATAAPSAASSVSTVTPPSATVTAGPSLSASATSAAGALGGTTSASIATFTGGAGTQKMPAMVMVGLVVGAMGAVL